MIDYLICISHEEQVIISCHIVHKKKNHILHPYSSSLAAHHVC